MKILKGIFKWIGVLFGILMALGVAQMAWGIYREPIAKQQAIDFCATVKLGQATDGLVERALASGAVSAFAKWTADKDGSRVMPVIYVGMPPFSRHICQIKADKVVTSAEYVYLD